MEQVVRSEFLMILSGTSQRQYRRSLSKTLFAQSLQKLIPEIRPEHLSPGGSGVRAQAMTRDGTLLQDFHLVQKPRALHVINAPSPAATASLAIAEEVVGRIGLN